MKVPSLVAGLALVLAAAGCGREARSADPDGEVRVAAATVAPDARPEGRAGDLRGPGTAVANSGSADEPARRPEMTLRSAADRRGQPTGSERSPDKTAPRRTSPDVTRAAATSQVEPPDTREADEPSPVADVEDAPPVVRSDPGRVEAPVPVVDEGPSEAADLRPPEVEVLYAPRGTELALRLERELSSREHAVGDLFWAEVSEDVVAPDGMVLIPIGTRARGRVWRNDPGGGDHRGDIELALDALIFDGEEVPVAALVLETSPVVEVGQSNTEAATKVATGAAAGAILGKILGKDAESAIHGAVAGAVAGTAVAMATRDEFLVLEEGSRIVIRLDEEVPIPPR